MWAGNIIGRDDDKSIYHSVQCSQWRGNLIGETRRHTYRATGNWHNEIKKHKINVAVVNIINTIAALAGFNLFQEQIIGWLMPA